MTSSDVDIDMSIMKCSHAIYLPKAGLFVLMPGSHRYIAAIRSKV